jgi:hypothetical protein
MIDLCSMLHRTAVFSLAGSTLSCTKGTFTHSDIGHTEKCRTIFFFCRTTFWITELDCITHLSLRQSDGCGTVDVACRHVWKLRLHFILYYLMRHESYGHRATDVAVCERALTLCGFSTVYVYHSCLSRRKDCLAISINNYFGLQVYIFVPYGFILRIARIAIMQFPPTFCSVNFLSLRAKYFPRCFGWNIRSVCS